MIPITLYEYAAVVRRVYDGDTIFADVDQGFGVWRHGMPLRLYGVNAPEMRGADRPRGELARDALRLWIDGKTVWIRTHKADAQDKYGRYLAEVWTLEGINVNQLLVAEGLAVPYMLDT
jgi:micrococcal nuclease